MRGFFLSRSEFAAKLAPAVAQAAKMIASGRCTFSFRLVRHQSAARRVALQELPGLEVSTALIGTNSHNPIWQLSITMSVSPIFEMPPRSDLSGGRSEMSFPTGKTVHP